jgi:hypothetical protein
MRAEVMSSNELPVSLVRFLSNTIHISHYLYPQINSTPVRGNKMTHPFSHMPRRRCPHHHHVSLGNRPQGHSLSLRQVIL